MRYGKPTLRKDLRGKRFGRLVAIEPTEDRKFHSVVWKCQCDCGKIVFPSVHHLLDSHTRSCGCLQKETVSKIRTLNFGTANSTKLYIRYKDSAKKRNLEFLLSKEDFRYITSQPCFYCGKIPSQSVNYKRLNGAYIHNGIDRIDNSKGYTIDNCVPCCKTCNRAKDVMTKGEFLLWIQSVYIHNSLGDEFET